MGIAKRLAIIFIFLAVLIGIFYVKREDILGSVGSYLVVDMTPKRSDLIVILRGDDTFTRTLEGIELWKMKYADYICISTSLKDGYAKRLKTYDIHVETNQDRLVNLMSQASIPPENIIIDKQPPGGGTNSELRRIRNVILAKEFKSVIIVSSWYHTRRISLMAADLFESMDISYFVVAAKDDIASARDWWRYRYECIRVMEEYAKLIVFYLNRVCDITFSDDPRDFLG